MQLATSTNESVIALANPLDSLRAACGEMHEKLHLHPLLKPLTQADITLVDYHWILRAFDMAYRHMESRRRVRSDRMPDAPVLQWLAQDMKLHGLSPEFSSLQVPYPAVDSFPKLAGYLYVKQGSTLGGRVISKQLAKHLGLSDGGTNHFFAGYGDETGQQWKRFMIALTHYIRPGEEAETCRQAVASFQLIARCCDRMLDRKLSC